MKDDNNKIIDKYNNIVLLSDIDNTIYDDFFMKTKVNSIINTIKRINNYPIFITGRPNILSFITKKNIIKEFDKFFLVNGKFSIFIMYIFSYIIYFLSFKSINNLKNKCDLFTANNKFNKFINFTQNNYKLNYTNIVIFFGDNKQGDPLFGIRLINYLSENNIKCIVLIRDVKNILNYKNININKYILDNNVIENMYIFNNNILEEELFQFLYYFIHSNNPI